MAVSRVGLYGNTGISPDGKSLEDERRNEARYSLHALSGRMKQ
jgi:hypothetical protein